MWKAAKCVEMEHKNWTVLDIIGIDIADPQMIIFLRGVCITESFPTKYDKIKAVGIFRKESIDNTQVMTFVENAFFIM